MNYKITTINNLKWNINYTKLQKLNDEVKLNFLIILFTLKILTVIYYCRKFID